MRVLKIIPKNIGKIPVEAEVFSPNMLAGKSVEDVGELNVHVGNRQLKVKEFFELEGDIGDQGKNQKIVLEGDFSKVKYIGNRMAEGIIVINGDAGMHTGAEMSGGEIRVNGSVGEWAGAEMKGGLMIIDGEAGHQLGCAYRGSSEGMTGGCIVVKGNAGVEAGLNMRRGMIVIQGGVGQFAGAHSNGGQILVFGKTSKRAGAMAKGNGGFLACLGGVEDILPTYRYNATYKPVFVKLYMRQLAEELGITEAEKFMDKPFEAFRGDLSVGGNFEILVAED